MQSLGKGIAKVAKTAQLTTREPMPDYCFHGDGIHNEQGCGRVLLHLPGVADMIADRIGRNRVGETPRCSCSLDREQADLRRWLDARLPEGDKRWEQWQPRAGTEKAFAAAQRFARQEGPKILTLLGIHGTGKSFLAGCIARDILGNGGTVAYEYVPRLLENLRNAAGSQDSEGDRVSTIMDRCRGAQLLVLDDLGRENTSDFAVASITSLVQDRMDRGRRLVVTTNLAHDQLAKKHDGAYAPIASRLFAVNSGEAAVAALLASDYRTGA